MSVADFDLYGGRVTFVIKACSSGSFQIFFQTQAQEQSLNPQVIIPGINNNKLRYPRD